MVRYKKKKGRRMKRPNKATFDYQYYDLDIKPEDMAEMYGVKLSTIYNWATLYRKEDMESEKI